MSHSKLVLAISLAIAMMPQACFGTPQEGVKSLLSSSTQTPQKSSQTDIPDADKQARIKAEVAEIMAIREQLGGGVAKTLGDLSLEMPGSKPQNDSAVPNETSDESFAQKLIEQSKKHATQENTSKETIPKGYQLVKIKAVDDADQNDERRGFIRDAARMLEEAAALLEEAQQYDQADAIRDNASQLWRSAR